jgi:1-aminocyclopropane-1-carboxylate deaminase
LTKISLYQNINRTALGVKLQRANWPSLERKGLRVYIRRDDQLSQYYSGNKYYKLFYNLRNALQQSADCLVSFGGAYSNHLYALAAAGKELNIPTVGIVRGYESAPLTPTLADAANSGMQLHFLSKKEYRDKNISQILPILKQSFPNYYLIPEGAENIAGSRGCMAISSAVSQQLGHENYTLCCPVGTGSTLTGLIAGTGAQCLGFSVLKGEDKLSAKVQQQLEILGRESSSWQLLTGFHHGGYGKVSNELLQFMRQFEENNQLQLEPVYTAKMFWGIEKLAEQNFWPEGSIVVAIHTGGLQGRRGFISSTGPDDSLS